MTGILRSFGPGTPNDTLAGAQIRFRDLLPEEVELVPAGTEPYKNAGELYIAKVGDDEPVPLAYTTLEQAAASAAKTYAQINREQAMKYSNVQMVVLVLMYDDKHFGVRWQWDSVANEIKDTIIEVGGDYLQRKANGEFDTELRMDSSWDNSDADDNEEDQRVM